MELRFATATATATATSRGIHRAAGGVRSRKRSWWSQQQQERGMCQCQSNRRLCSSMQSPPRPASRPAGWKHY